MCDLVSQPVSLYSCFNWNIVSISVAIMRANGAAHFSSLVLVTKSSQM
jgi:hypothetical protein